MSLAWEPLHHRASLNFGASGWILTNVPLLCRQVHEYSATDALNFLEEHTQLSMSSGSYFPNPLPRASVLFLCVHLKSLVPARGVEPLASSLQVTRSTTWAKPALNYKTGSVLFFIQRKILIFAEWILKLYNNNYILTYLSCQHLCRIKQDIHFSLLYQTELLPHKWRGRQDLNLRPTAWHAKSML